MAQPSAPLVRAATVRGVATLTLDSPHNRNALSTALMRRLREALAAAVADDAVRVIVLDHAGPVFCSGIDLAEAAAASAGTAGGDPAASLPGLLADVWECPKPVVARVAGPARAGGLGLVAAADVAICAEPATFAFTEVRLGVVPAVISAVVLPRLAPRAAARLFLTGEVFDGPAAARAGLVTAAVPAGELDAAVTAVCAELVRAGPGAHAGTKALLRRFAAPDLRTDLAALAELSVGYFRSAEAREGMAAFRERRDPSWVTPAADPPLGGHGTGDVR
jgi:methylglutaconyl-CoA hydratase